MSNTLDEILSQLNAKIVIQVCANFALKDELGELSDELNDKRAKEHQKLIDTAKQQIQALITEAREEAFQHGLITGAMPEAIGKPIAQNYLTQLKEKL